MKKMLERRLGVRGGGGGGEVGIQLPEQEKTLFLGVMIILYILHVVCVFSVTPVWLQTPLP